MSRAFLVDESHDRGVHRFAIVALLPGCICMGDFDQELDVVEGSSVLHPGERVALALDSEGYHAGPDQCRGHWYVNGVEGGNLVVGLISRCGIYYATGWPHEASEYEVLVEAGESEMFACADCCPWQSITLTIVR